MLTSINAYVMLHARTCDLNLSSLDFFCEPIDSDGIFVRKCSKMRYFEMNKGINIKIERSSEEKDGKFDY